MREIPKEKEVYRHFKGKYYQVIAVARHTEYDEQLVIYRPLFEEGEVYARPIGSFLSEVDKNIYPEARQQYRFTLASGETHGGGKSKASGEELLEEKKKEAPEPRTPVESYEEPETEIDYLDDDSDSVLDPELEAFLDERSYDRKLDIFMLLRKRITEDMLQTIAIDLDIRLAGETIEDRCLEVLDCIKTKKKYESDRLR
ncbi:MAG: DUF1653 domain-containing protein [Lachnospiraceae bacterium]|nr:DUF1653 domain-containing protein [Lachnospiraceae bacterium]